MVAYQRTIDQRKPNGEGAIVVAALANEGFVEIQQSAGVWSLRLELDDKRTDVPIGQHMQPQTALLALAAMRVVEAVDLCGEICFATVGASVHLLERAERFLHSPNRPA